MYLGNLAELFHGVGKVSWTRNQLLHVVDRRGFYCFYFYSLQSTVLIWSLTESFLNLTTAESVFDDQILQIPTTGNMIETNIIQNNVKQNNVERTGQFKSLLTFA